MLNVPITDDEVEAKLDSILTKDSIPAVSAAMLYYIYRRQYGIKIAYIKTLLHLVKDKSE